MKKTTIVFLFICFFLNGNAQYMAKNTYWFYFSDKNNCGYSVEQATQFLSERAIERRAWQKLAIDESDLPISKTYSDSLKSLGLNIKYCSKWLNGVLLQSENKTLIDTLHHLSFIDTIPWKKNPTIAFYPTINNSSRFIESNTDPKYHYGYSFDQVSQIRLDQLHKLGYTGSGVLIAVLDAGFYHMETLPSFQKHYQQNMIISEKNFVHPEEDVYNYHTHGTNVSSIIVANWNDTLIGTAPDAELILGMTENPDSETKIEVLGWVAGIEWADSIGADIINTSLGYTEFDDSSTNYTFESLDGYTSLASRANSLAAKKGIISVTSAGNEGNDPWFYIGTPADATDILSVGAVNNDGSLTDFSSHGPSYDNRIKPEIVAMGGYTAVQGTDGSVRFGSGTSFSAPVIAGATACLWQAYPELSAIDMIRSIINTGNQRWNANVNFGYGIPDYIAAYHQISSMTYAKSEGSLYIYPNPYTEQFYVQIPEYAQGTYDVSLIDISGRIIYKTGITDSKYIYTPSIPSGLYIIQLENTNNKFRSSIIKK